jgi:protein gp37
VGKTSIEWTDQSWPVINGCRRVSAGCENCYAERLTASRLSKTPKYQGLAVMGKNGPRWTGETRLWEPHLSMPMRLRKPSRIFVADMGDLFYEGVPDYWIETVFAVMAMARRHTFQVLTKRPERMRDFVLSAAKAKAAHDIALLHYNPRQLIAEAEWPGWPLPNVWLGVSVEDQASADKRIPFLLETPAAVRFLSYEPALGPLHLDPSTLGCVGHLAQTFGNLLVNWVNVGGETGPGARPFDIRWARSAIDQCAAAAVPCFVKQLGARPFQSPRNNASTGYDLALTDRKGGDMEEWPADLRVREFPQPRPTP